MSSNWMVAGVLIIVVPFLLWAWLSNVTLINDYYEPTSKRYFMCLKIKRESDFDFISMDSLIMNLYTDKGDFLGTYKATVPAEEKRFNLLQDESGTWFLEGKRKHTLERL